MRHDLDQLAIVGGSSFAAQSAPLCRVGFSHVIHLDADGIAGVDCLVSTGGYLVSFTGSDGCSWAGPIPNCAPGVFNLDVDGGRGLRLGDRDRPMVPGFRMVLGGASQTSFVGLVRLLIV